MAINVEAAQLVVGAAILDRQFCRQLLEHRAEALATISRQPCAPEEVRLTRADRLALTAIRARSLREFALGIERARSVVRSHPVEEAVAELMG